MSLLVHGVVEARSVGALASTDVMDEEPAPETVTHLELAALVTPTAHDEVLPSRANLLHHTAVLEAVGQRTTVVPMRFGVVVPDAEALIRDYLSPEHDRLLATLRRLEGHDELRLRGRYDEPSVIEAVLAADPRAARLRGRDGFDAKMELGERIVSGIEQRRASDTDRTIAALRPYAADVAPSELGEPLDAFLLSFLVARPDRQAFDDRLDRLGEELAPVVRLELTGPIPPFSFAAGQVDAWA